MTYLTQNLQYKTVVLIGGELNNIQVVIDKNEKIFEAIVAENHTWTRKYYKESSPNPFEFVLQDTVTVDTYVI